MAALTWPTLQNHSHGLKGSGDIPDRSPKRVVLRLKVSEFEGCTSPDFDHAIKAYLLFAGRPTDRDEMQRHYAHVEPFQAPELKQTSFHIIIDFDKDLLVDGNLRGLPHEIYCVRRVDDTL
jgi:hypothetical protein